MRQAITTVTVVSCLLISGCSTSAENISGTYVSPLAYHSYDCEQLTQEAVRIGRKVQEVTGQQNEEATGDAVAVGVGIIFWPALFFMFGSDREEELARLKGEAEGIEQAAIQKNCKSLLERIDKGKEAAEKQEET